MKKVLLTLLSLLVIQTAYSQLDTKTNSQDLLLMSGISVTIGGNFPITGSFPALTTERVDQFVTTVYNDAKEKALRTITDPQLLEQINKKLNDYSLRDITLKREDGQVLHIDLLKFRLTGDFKDNPYLKNNDVLIFPPIDKERDFFTISGAVNQPGKFLYVPGDKLSDAVLLAQGINKAYENVTKAEIDRLSYDGNTMNSDTVNISSNYPLKRGDRIIVLAKYNQRKDFSVMVLGEVNSPGNYPITKDSTTLSDVIRMAGGIKSSGSLAKARVYAGSTLPLLLEKEYGIKLKNSSDLLNVNITNFILRHEQMIMSRMSNLTEEDTTYFKLESQLNVLEKGSGVDFTQLNDKNSAASKYLMNNGDIVLIPQKRSAVYVFGQVVHPGFIPFRKGADYKYYLEKAGGAGPLAEDGIMLIKAGSEEWISVDKHPVIEDGDYIYVPKSPQRSFNYYVGRVGQYLSIVSSVATIILLLISLRKL